jgi:hypothetical protein
MADIGNYVLITAARNEEQHIEQTLKSVVAQSIKPRKWVIVSDGSTDRTDAIVSEYAARVPYLQLLRVEGEQTRNFGSKAQALHRGYGELNDTEYDFIGIVDADVSLPLDYYESILAKFAQDPKLGLAGGIVIDFYDGRVHKVVTREHSVRGAVQVFRRQCYEEIGGMPEVRGGGMDSVAEVLTRMRGWRVRSFSEVRGLHLKPTGRTLGSTWWRVRFREGQSDYMLGYHLLFMVFKCISRIVEKPYFIGALLRLTGFLTSIVRRQPRSVPQDVIDFIQQEQLQRLRHTLSLSRLGNRRN